PIWGVLFGGMAPQVGEGEAVVAGGEVDGAGGGPAGRLVDVGAPAEAGRERTREAGIAAPETPDVVAIAIVPFRPARRKGAEAVPVGGVPRLGDQLDVAEEGILRDSLEQRRAAEQLARGAAREHG